MGRLLTTSILSLGLNTPRFRYEKRVVYLEKGSLIFTLLLVKRRVGVRALQ